MFLVAQPAHAVASIEFRLEWFGSMLEMEPTVVWVISSFGAMHAVPGASEHTTSAHATHGRKDMTVKEFKTVNHYRFIGMWSGRNTRCGNCRNRARKPVMTTILSGCDIPCSIVKERLICRACSHGFLTDQTFVCDNWVSTS